MSHNKIEQSENQLAPAKAKPEDFVIQKWNTTQSVTGAEEDDVEAAAKSNAMFDRGSNYEDTTDN